MDDIKMEEKVTSEAMREDSVVSVSDIYQAMGSNYAKQTTINWRGYDVVIRNAISYDEMDNFVNTVVNACFDQETGEYLPQNKDFMYKYGEILFYSNIELPRDTGEAYEIIYTVPLNELIREHANHDQIVDIQNAITEKIQHRLDTELDTLEAEMHKFEDVFRALGETVSAIDPEELKKTIAAIGSHGRLDESKVVKALFEQKTGGEK